MHLAYIQTRSHATVYMKSYPSKNTLNNPVKRQTVEQMLQHAKMDLQIYMTNLNNTTIKEKQILTNDAMQVLLQSENKPLFNNLKQKYPERFLDSMYFI